MWPFLGLRTAGPKTGSQNYGEKMNFLYGLSQI